MTARIKVASLPGGGNRATASANSPGACEPISSRVGFYSPRQPGTLTAAQADLVRLAGGIDRAADIAGKSKSQMQRYTEDNGEPHMPVDIVRRLESAVGDPVVSRFLAAEQSCVLVSVPAAGSAEDEIGLDVIAVGDDFGQMCRDYHAAMLNPKSRNYVDTGEAGGLVVDIDQMMGHLATMRLHAVAKRDGGRGDEGGADNG